MNSRRYLTAVVVLLIVFGLLLIYRGGDNREAVPPAAPFQLPTSQE